MIPNRQNTNEPTRQIQFAGLHLTIMQNALARMRQRGDRNAKRKESEERYEDVEREKVSPTEHQKKPAVANG